jgi:hypothetical protein
MYTKKKRRVTHRDIAKMNMKKKKKKTEYPTDEEKENEVGRERESQKTIAPSWRRNNNEKKIRKNFVFSFV